MHSNRVSLHLVLNDFTNQTLTANTVIRYTHDRRSRNRRRKSTLAPVSATCVMAIMTQFMILHAETYDVIAMGIGSCGS